ncbi:MAG: RNA methyltransferase [Opitutales bacterium]|nr:RNA methyltransferase [Opitutales bacterium]
MIEKITSKQNPKIKFFIKLRDRAKRKRTGMFIVEGFRELTRALDSEIESEFFLFCPKFFKNQEFEKLVERAQMLHIPSFELTADVFEKISIRERCDGILGICHIWETRLDDFIPPKNPLLLVVDGIEKPGNLGALIRSAESAGVDAMIVCSSVTDIFNHNVVRASQGALFSLPIFTADRAEARDFLLKHGLAVLATTPKSSTLYWEINMNRPSAVIVGSEHDGLPDCWLSGDDVQTMAIPQRGLSDSLNVNDAAVVVLYEAVRQRYQATQI